MYAYYSIIEKQLTSQMKTTEAESATGWLYSEKCDEKVRGKGKTVFDICHI